VCLEVNLIAQAITEAVEGVERERTPAKGMVIGDCSMCYPPRESAFRRCCEEHFRHGNECRGLPPHEHFVCLECRTWDERPDLAATLSRWETNPEQFSTAAPTPPEPESEERSDERPSSEARQQGGE
jgi:hypothetical protein